MDYNKIDGTDKEALLYQSRSGRRPFEEWLEALKDQKGRAKIRVRIARARAGNLGRHAYWDDYKRRSNEAREKLS